MSLNQLYLTLLTGGVVLLASIIGTRVATRIGFPSLLFFLAVGMILGVDGIGLDFNNVELARNVCTTALAIVLVEGGLTTRFS
nr:potassium/proton antiporter [Streptomyces sp. DSM 41633]